MWIYIFPQLIDKLLLYNNQTMTDKPLKISVVTVCYNAIGSIEETMLSVLNQTYSHVEYIVIDGVSTDGTVDVIKKYSDRLAYWVSESDSGIYDAMNKGIRAATGDYIININAGDKLLYLPIEKLKQCLKNSSIGLCGAIVDENGAIYYPNTSWRMKYRNQLPHQGLFYKTMSQRLYDTRYKILGDYDLNLSYLKDGFDFELSQIVVAEHSFDGISNSKKTNKECYEIINKYFGFVGMVKAYIYYKIVALKVRIFQIFK